MGNPVVHFEIIGADGKALQDFYSRLFGWKIDANNPMNYGVVDTESGGKGIGGGVGPSQDGSKSTVFYIEVDDINRKVKDVEAAGGKILMPVTDIPGMVTFAQFADLEGNVVGLVDSKIPG
jgi:hypothetical protein